MTRSPADTAGSLCLFTAMALLMVSAATVDAFQAAAGSTTKRTTITSYNVMTTDNTSPGALAEMHVSQGFVNNVNIVAVHSRDWATYKDNQIDITYKGTTARFVVLDMCSDKDCGSCCTANANYNGNGFLADVDSSAAKRIWGIGNAENMLKDSATFRLVPGGPVDVAALKRKYL